MTIGLSTRPAWAACRPHRHGEEVAIIGAGMAGMTAAYELMRMGLKPVVYEAGAHRRAPALAGLRGCGRHHRRTGRHALSRLVHRLLPLCRSGPASKSKPFPNPLSPAHALDRHRSRRQDHLCRKARRPAAACIARSARPGPRRSRKALASRRFRMRSAPAMSRHSRGSGIASCRSGTIAASMISSRPPMPLQASPSDIARSSARSASAPAAGIRIIPIRCWRSCASASPNATRTSALSSAASSRCRAACGA